MKGCLLIHGFTGSPKEVLPIALYLQAETDWLISTPILAGHEEVGKLNQVHWKDWIFSAEKALKELLQSCEEVYVFGFSMGGMIAAYLSTKYPIKKLILLSAAVFTPNKKQMFKDISQLISGYVLNQESVAEHLSRYRRKMVQTPFRAVLHFRRLVRELKPCLKQVNAPILIIHGEKDDLVHPKSAQYIFENIASTEKELVYLKNSKHVVCHDCEVDQILEKVNQFLLKDLAYIG